MIVHSSSSGASSDTDNEQTGDNTQNTIFTSEKLDSLQRTADDAVSAVSDDETQYSAGALPRPAWMDASSQDSSVADARVQSIRDIIRVSDYFLYTGYFVYLCRCWKSLCKVHCRPHIHIG